jgi:YfiH family protein
VVIAFLQESGRIIICLYGQAVKVAWVWRRFFVVDNYHFTSFSAFPELIHGFSDRAFGSVYPEGMGGQRLLAEALGILPGSFVSTYQVHGDRVVSVPGSEYTDTAGQLGADGLVTALPGLFLLGYFADCVPILAYDPVRRVVGLAHAGWRGTLLDIAGQLVRKMVSDFATLPQDTFVGIGPSIGPCCYEVGPEVVSRVQEELPHPDLLLACRSERPGHAHLDLWAANRVLLMRAGISPSQIEVAGHCTSCLVERFFSYRREGELRGLFGAVIGMKTNQRGG